MRVLAGIVFVHLVLLTRLFPLSTALSPEPVLSTDHALHFARTVSVGGNFLTHGALWGYDPFHLAGYPAGSVTDLDNKGGEVVVGLLGPVLGYGRAWNLLLFLGYALVPLLVFAAAAALGLPRGDQLASAAVASLTWHLSSSTSNYVLHGGYGFVLASMVAPLVFALVVRFIGRPSVKNGALLMATTPLFYIHVHLGLLVAVLCAGLVYPALRAGTRAWGGLALVAVGTVVVNLPWIHPMLRDWGMIESGLPHMKVADPLFKGLLQDVLAGRFYDLVLPVIAGGAGLILMARGGRRSTAIVWGAAACAMLLAAYEGRRIELVRSLVMPDRLMVTLPIVLAIPAAIALRRCAVWASTRFGVGRSLLVVAVAAVVCAPQVVVPAATRVFGKARVRPGLPKDGYRFLNDLAKLGDPAGRIAMEEVGPLDGGKPPFGTYLAAIGPLSTGRAWIGGPYYIGWIPHSRAAFVAGKLCGRPIETLSDDELAGMFDLYDVTGVAACLPRSVARLREAGSVVEEAGEVLPFVLFRVRRSADPFLVGRGKVRVGYDWIEVTTGSSDPVVVKLHYDPRFVCDGDVRIEREPVPDDPVGFIRLSPARAGTYLLRMAGRGVEAEAPVRFGGSAVGQPGSQEGR